MKNTTLVLALLTLVACGKHSHSTKKVYIENPFDNSVNDTRLDDVETRLADLSLDIDDKLAEIEATRLEDLEANQEAMNELEQELNNLVVRVVALETRKNVTSIKFCNASTSTYPEYGIKLDNDVFAVYWTGSQAFLTKLNPGSYTTTTGSQDCQFTIL